MSRDGVGDWTSGGDDVVFLPAAAAAVTAAEALSSIPPRHNNPLSADSSASTFCTLKIKYTNKHTHFYLTEVATVEPSCPSSR